jgi:hypothetical protein
MNWTQIPYPFKLYKKILSFPNSMLYLIIYYQQMHLMLILFNLKYLKQ